MYAAPYAQNLPSCTALLCANVITDISTMREAGFHVEIKGPPILGLKDPRQEGAIKNFTDVRVLGPCDGTCRAKPGIIYKIVGFFQRICFSFPLVGAIVEARKMECSTFSRCDLLSPR